MAANSYPTVEGTDLGRLCSLDNTSHDIVDSAMATGSNSLENVKEQRASPTVLHSTPLIQFVFNNAAMASTDINNVNSLCSL